MKRHLIIGVRKSLKHVPNNKISDFGALHLSGCSAMCLTAILSATTINALISYFCKQGGMMFKLLKEAKKDRDCFEIGATATVAGEHNGNLVWTIENFAKARVL